MKRTNRLPVRPQSQRGSAMVEYALISALVVIVLLSGPSVITQILEAIRQVYEAFTFAIGLTYPTPP